MRMSRKYRVVAACVLANTLLAAQACAPDATTPLPPESGSRTDLVYSYHEQLIGLGETVAIEKTPLGAIVTRADGRRQSLASVREADHAARLAKFGALNPAYALTVARAAADRDLIVQVHGSLGDEHRAIARRLGSTERRIRKAAQQDWLRLVTQFNERFAEELTALGLREAEPASGMPMVTGVASKSLVQRLARLPNITFVSGALPGKRTDFSATNWATDSRMDVAFNNVGHYGQGQKVGTLELGRTGLFDPHLAFSNLETDSATGYRITYMDEPMDCNFNSDCAPGADCMNILHPGHPKQCVVDHASRTASAFADDQSGAARARLFYANRPRGSMHVGLDVACSINAVADGYAWFFLNGVTTTWESWGCAAAADGQGAEDGIPQDYAARYYDISIFKAAGNQSTNTDDEKRLTPELTEPACPFTANSICVGGHTGAVASPQTVTPTSSWTNLNGPIPIGKYWNRTDREEPDLVARSLNVDRMDHISGATNYGQSSGTSFAAPSAAAVAALLKEHCGEGGDMNHLLVHAILRNSAYPRNMGNFRYSTPDPVPDPLSYPGGVPGWGRDWKDGAGAIDALAAMWHCDGQSGDGTLVSTGLHPGVLDEGEPAPFAGCTHCGSDAPLGGKSGKISLKSYTEPGPGDSRTYHKFWESSSTADLPANTRIRATIVWDACPASLTGVAPAPNATDIDLVLVNVTAGRAVTVSQSIQDNVEGFDVEISEPGQYALYWTNPEGAKGCGDSGVEPLAHAVVWGTF